MVLDNGQRWEPEDFQLAFMEDLFGGYEEVWLVLPEGNAKTTLLAGVGLYHLDYTPDAMVPIGASSRDQIEILHNQAAGFVRRTPGLENKRFKIYDGYRRIKGLRLGGKMQVYAADERTGDGVIPTLPLLDELHRHRDLRLYRTWRGKIEKRGGQLAAISTAGEPDGEFEEIRTRHRSRAEKVKRRGAFTRAVGGGMVLHDYAVQSEDDVEDMAKVKEANPLSTKTIDSLQRKRESPTMTLDHWKRLTCNIATRLESDGVKPEEWDALADPNLKPKKSAWSLGWIDLGWQIDTTALGVLIWESTKRRVIAGVTILEPPVQEADIVEALVRTQREFEPVGWVFDPNAGGQQMAQLLESGEHPHQDGVAFEFIEHAQTNTPMALAAARFDEAVRNGWFVHDASTALRAHVLNGVRRSVGGERYRYDRPDHAKGKKRTLFPIDALTGVLMGNSVAVAEKLEAPPKKEPLVAWA